MKTEWTASELRKELTRIQRLFDKAETIFNTLPDYMQHIILDYHNENTSLNHCIMWGQQAAEELVSDAKELVKEYNEE